MKTMKMDERVNRASLTLLDYLSALLIVIGVLFKYVGAGCNGCKVSDSKVMLNNYCCLNRRELWDKMLNHSADPKRKICCDFSNEKSENEADVEYIQSNIDGGCCIYGKFYRRCLCYSILNKKVCRSMCSDDHRCKGYVMRELPGNTSYCQVATASPCLDGCNGPRDITNVFPMECHYVGQRDVGTEDVC